MTIIRKQQIRKEENPKFLLIQPKSPELRELMAKAIKAKDLPLLAKIRKLEGQEFVLCRDFTELLMATSEPETVPIIVTTELDNSLFNVMSGG